MIDKTYYNKMLKKGRLIPFIIGDKLIGFVSFYITNDVNKYLRDDPWTVLEDEPETGKVCWVDQCWTQKCEINGINRTPCLTCYGCSVSYSYRGCVNEKHSR